MGNQRGPGRYHPITVISLPKFSINFQFSILNSQFNCISLQSHNKGDEHQERN